MTRRSPLVLAFVFALATHSLGCGLEGYLDEQGGTFAWWPYGFVLHSDGDFPPPPRVEPEPPEPPADGLVQVTICGVTYAGVPMEAPAHTAIRIWEETNGHDSLSICVWTGGFDCEPSLAGLLASDGITLVALCFHTPQQFDACGGAAVIDAGILNESVCATATAVGQHADGTFVIMSWPENCR